MSVMTAERAKTGYALARDEGEAFWLLGMLETVKIGRADTDGRFGLLEILVKPGDGSPWHVHPEEDEWFYVLDGQVTFYVGDTRMDLGAGGFAYGPKGVPHTFIGAGDRPARALVGFAPMQFEGFLREVGEPAPERALPPAPPADAPPPDIAKLSAIGTRNGLVILGPPGPPPGHGAAAR
jgi:quercetin dioxygenase-like cupin family protein